jgi:hypothetical protein
MLPKLDVPIYTIKLISTWTRCSYSSISSKRTKTMFLMAAESEDAKR